MKKGNISVQTENIFPIIKQFLYSDQEIFLRELISNAVDATSKIKTLSSRGDLKSELGDLTIDIVVDKAAKTISIKDRGIGMDEEEVKKYLNQVAFSSAQEFLEKYEKDSGIIGHFGLGFYSAFMVAGRVEVVTKSYKEDAPAVKWACEGDPNYTLEDNDRTDRGTDIILHVTDDAAEYLEDNRIEELLMKYCKFLPVPIRFGTKEETIYEGEGDDKEAKTITSDNIINNTEPAWKKLPVNLKDEDYKNFYKELYPFSQPPMFWIHLNIDYPFNLTGVLFFPKLGNNFETQKNKIQLYSNQVYVTDDVKEIVPEFLTLLHGVIDSPDIPLNVSRSYLQSDRNVKKITGYITKKVAEKLNDLFTKEREDYESKWKDLSVFVKYGMISDEKFYEKATKFALVTNTEGKHFTMDEYKEHIKTSQTDKHGKIVGLYTIDPDEHHSYLEAAKAKGYDVLKFDNIIDNHFMQSMEHKMGDITFVRVDSDTVDNLVQKDEKLESVLTDEQQEKIKAMFQEQITDVTASVSMKALSPDDQPVIITRPEFMRRMKEMQNLQGGGMMGGFPDSYNVVINSNHPLISEKLLKMKKAEKKAEFTEYLFNLARLNQNMLKGAELSKFIQTSIGFLK